MGWLGTALAGIFRGIGAAFMDWLRWRKAEKDRARADTAESYIGGDLAAEKTEAGLVEARDNAQKKPLSEIL